MSNIELKIVQFLFDHEHQYLSSQEIAESNNVSDKTVRKYIKALNTTLNDYGAIIEVKKGSGYRLNVSNNKLFYQLLDHIREQKNMVEDSKLLTDNEDREKYILNYVLLENQQLTIDDLAEVMFISKSTVSLVIQLIKARLNKFKLEITYDQDGYIVIEGKEVYKRRFILQYFFSSSLFDQYINTDLIDYQYEGFSAETIFIVVLEKCREFDVQLSDFVLQNLVLHIALAIKRNEKGFAINKVDVDETIEYSKELLVAKKIVASIEKLINIKFSQDEANYIALHLKSKSTNQKIINENQKKLELSIQSQLVEALGNLRNQNRISFSIDHQLIMGLKTHFEPLLNRLKLNISLKNPLQDEIKEKYSDVFDMTKDYFSHMPILSQYEIDDHEWAYITLHILSAIERYKRDTKVNVIVLCATGLGSAQMLKSRLENEFSANINILEVTSYYQLNDKMLENVDLIITTINISTSFYNIPVVKVSVFLNRQDIDSLNEHIKHYPVQKDTNDEINAVDKRSNDLFNRYFDKTRFMVFNAPVSREDVLLSMTQTLTDAGQSSFDEDFKNQIHIREQLGTLAFTKTVAFPHPAQPVGINSEIVVGLIPAGIKWDSDHPSIKVLVLMSPSRIKNKGLDTINSGLAELISHEDNITSILEQASFEQFRHLFMRTLTAKGE
ncbi:BglG family transcription antiterminator [Alkalibacterium olivapovliticus]|uniref:Lichenan operon transcriptional antiterminator n=1 Tax=Alkalibacterium olivapovliticus TaxID=99907 RepID=A0A2T0VWI5_9LACT|nr:PRD domain-containing protein [Alkalibacterium olivapovliticus]PRY76186.1 lichenan operon transcriptional antiterminator [Alkalibacterium olivapovliticus]